MNELFFWNDWKKPYKFLYLFLLTVFAVSLLVYIIGYIAGTKAFIDWDVITQFDTLSLPADHFTRHLIQYSVDVNNYISKERFFASEVRITPWFGTILWLLVSIGIIIALTVITRLEFAWFGIGMAIFIFILSLVIMQNKGIPFFFGPAFKKYALISICCYAGIGFYFQAYDTRLSFLQRVLVFTLLTAILGALIEFRSGVPSPFYYLANFCILFPIIISILFIISISFEIITGFLYITSGKISNRNSSLHFTVISVLYLTNLLLIFLKKKNIIQVNFILIDVFVIYTASTIIGIWGLRKRHFLFRNFITFSHACFLYIAFAIITTSTIAYAFLTGNDPLITAFEYIILYSHLGIGMVFFLYILYNFWELFERNLSAYDLMYEPRRMPFFMVRPIGLIIMLSLFMQSGMYAYKMARAGCHNLSGDVYYKEGKLKEAKEEYEEGTLFAKGNLKSSLALATIMPKLNYTQQARESMLGALEKKPSEYAYTNLANLYLQDDNFFYAFFTLKEGLKKFPASGYLNNNLAVLYSTKGMWDSTYYYLRVAGNLLKDDAVHTNLTWLVLQRKLLLEADSLSAYYNHDHYLPYQINRIAALNGVHKKYTLHTSEFLTDSILNIRTYAYFYDQLLNQLRTTDTSLIKRINEYIKYSGNDPYYHELLFLKSLKLYYSGYANKGFKDLNDLLATVSPSSAAYYSKVLGLWSMQQAAYENAAEYFDQSARLNLLDPQAQLYKALALLEADYREDGLAALRYIANTPDKEVRTASRQLLEAFDAENTDILTAKDSLKYLYIHFRKEVSVDNKRKVLESFSNDTLKVLGAAALMEQLLSQSNTPEAEKIYNDFRQSSTTVKDGYIRSAMSYQYLRLLEQKQDWVSLQKEAGHAPLTGDMQYMNPYFSGIASHHLGKTADAQKLLEEALRRGPLNVDAYLALSAVYNAREDYSKAYEILVEGTRTNRHSASLLQAYALQALKINLTSYGDDALASLKDILQPKEYEAFRHRYEKEKAESEARFQNF